MPTVGCAKSVLTGVYKEPSNVVGATSPLYDKFNKTEIIGMVLRTQGKRKTCIHFSGPFNYPRGISANY